MDGDAARKMLRHHWETVCRSYQDPGSRTYQDFLVDYRGGFCGDGSSRLKSCSVWPFGPPFTNYIIETAPSGYQWDTGLFLSLPPTPQKAQIHLHTSLVHGLIFSKPSTGPKPISFTSYLTCTVHQAHKMGTTTLASELVILNGRKFLRISNERWMSYDSLLGRLGAWWMFLSY